MDRIFSSNPLNSTAAKVTGKGVHWTPARKEHPNLRQHVGPPTVIPPHLYPKDNGFEDLRGRRLGRLTVTGFIGKRNPKKKALWLVRCDCGTYEERTGATIKNAFADSACADCRYLEGVKRRAAGG